MSISILPNFWTDFDDTCIKIHGSCPGVHGALSDKTYLSLGLLSPLKLNELENEAVRTQA